MTVSFPPRRLVLLLVAALLAAPPAARAASGVPASAVWPLTPRPVVVSRFAPPEQRFGRGHRGVDLLGRPGQPVRAAVPGTVSFAGVVAGRPVVVVRHGRTRTTYQPVAAEVDRGQPVQAGQRLGLLLAAGSHCAPRACLHWGLIEDAETYLDPLSLLGAGPVRLLPLVPTGGLFGGSTTDTFGAAGPTAPRMGVAAWSFRQPARGESLPDRPAVDGWARTLTPAGVPDGRHA